MNKRIKKQITVQVVFLNVLVLVITFILSYLSISQICKQYNNRTANNASYFTEFLIDADDAKNYLNTRNIDYEYSKTLNNMKKYTEKNDIVRISLISYNNSYGYYIYDTADNKLGQKVEYDEYIESVKAELINGYKSWNYTNKGYTYSYVPLRTIDDKLAGYIITEVKNISQLNYILLLLVALLVLSIITFIFVKSLSRFIEKEVFEPLDALSQTAIDFTSSDKEDGFIHKDNEIGNLGNTIQKIISNINASSQDLSKAIYDSTHDAMTQTYNKRHYGTMIDTFKTYSSICAIYFDVNNLKLMNDTLGHEHGDYVIKKAAEYIKEFTNDSIMCFRMGGDEFLLVIGDCTFKQINNIVEKLDEDCPVILSPEEDSVKCALSYGYSYSKSPFVYEQILVEAEENMYKKKSELKKSLNMPDR